MLDSDSTEVRRLAQAFLQKKEAERERLYAMSSFERALFERALSEKFSLIAGVDEAGRGPLAGPVIAAAVILPKDALFRGLDDSKKLSAKERERLEPVIKSKALAWAVAGMNHRAVDRLNIRRATLEAMRKAVLRLNPLPDHILVDAETVPRMDIPQTAIIHGDALSVSVAAASVLAKTHRDRVMNALDALYPQYGFIRNKGYGSKEHIAALERYGLSPVHRLSFAQKFCRGLDQKKNDTRKKNGAAAENLAADFLTREGYSVIERNWRRAAGEIDIIAEKSGVWYFVEVRSRSGLSFGEPAESVNAAKKKQVRKMAELYLAEHGGERDCAMALAAVRTDTREIELVFDNF